MGTTGCIRVISKTCCAPQVSEHRVLKEDAYILFYIRTDSHHLQSADSGLKMNGHPSAKRMDMPPAPHHDSPLHPLRNKAESVPGVQPPTVSRGTAPIEPHSHPSSEGGCGMEDRRFSHKGVQAPPHPPFPKPWRDFGPSACDALIPDPGP